MPDMVDKSHVVHDLVMSVKAALKLLEDGQEHLLTDEEIEAFPRVKRAGVQGLNTNAQDKLFEAIRELEGVLYFTDKLSTELKKEFGT